MGGGISLPLIAILLSCPFLELKAIELSEIEGCKTPNQECTIKDPQNKNIQNTKPIDRTKITIETQIDAFTNSSTITLISNESKGRGISIENNGKISKFQNNKDGTISKGIYGQTIDELTNYGEMRGFWSMQTQTIIIDNHGIIKTNEGSYISGTTAANAAHFAFEASNNKITIRNYKIKIIETPSDFNSYAGYSDRTNNKNSHLSFWVNTNTTIMFENNDSKIILDFGGEFSLGEKYLLSKLITDTNGSNKLQVDFSRLALSDGLKDLYSLTNNGEYFIIKLLNKITETPITAIYKSNIRTMNNFMILSNSMIYPKKYYKSQNLRKSSLRDLPTANRGNPLIDSALSLKSYESFTYRNESVNRRIQRQNKRNYSRSLKDSSLRADSQNLRGNLPQNLNADSAKGDYYFILTPFINHNLFFESGRYNLSGFDYGFLTAFSARVAESNSLGAHFAFSYGSLNDKHDKDLSIRTMNFMLGLNYKLDLVYDMFFKARGDVFYFSNALDSATIKNIKPSNLGFGASILFGKDFDFKQGGVLGLEVGLDYKALKSNNINFDSQSYQKALYNLIYADLGLNYQKYFGGFGINLGGGFKANLAPKLAKSILLINSQNLDFVLDNDKYLGYANVGLSYVLNHKNFDMEFNLAYYGNYGDRVISNGGGFEWRTTW